MVYCSVFMCIIIRVRVLVLVFTAFFRMFDSTFKIGMNYVFSHIILLLVALHPVHVSYTSVDYSESKQRLELMIKCHHDDLVTGVFHRYGKIIEINDSTINQQSIALLSRYILESFCLVRNSNDTLKLGYKRMQTSDDELFVYFESIVGQAFQSITITNMVFDDLYFDQNNLLICSYNNKQEAYSYTYNNTRHTFNFTKP
jgi:hypothetical protein